MRKGQLALKILLIKLGGFLSFLSSLYSVEYFDTFSWQTAHQPFVIHTIPKCGTHFIEKVVKLMTSHGIVHRYITLPNLQQAAANNQVVRSIQIFNKDLLKTLKANHHLCLAMYRDPRDALISHLFYMRNYPLSSSGDNRLRDFFKVGPKFDDISFEEQLHALIVGNEHADSYIHFYKERMKWALSKFTLGIKYEDLVGEQGGGESKKQKQTVLKIARYINLELTPEKLSEVLRHMYEEKGIQDDPNYTVDGKVYKRSMIGNWKLFITRKQKSLIKKMIGKELILLGYEKDLNW